MDVKKRFRRLLTSIADGRSLSTPALRRAYLDFGSETDDNKACAAAVGICTIRDAKRRTTGLALRRRRLLLSEILNAAEGSSVPRQVRRRFDGITQREW